MIRLRNGRRIGLAEMLDDAVELGGGQKQRDGFFDLGIRQLLGDAGLDLPADHQEMKELVQTPHPGLTLMDGGIVEIGYKIGKMAIGEILRSRNRQCGAKGAQLPQAGG
jgi:hypothetical protein